MKLQLARKGPLRAVGSLSLGVVVVACSTSLEAPAGAGGSPNVGQPSGGNLSTSGGASSGQIGGRPGSGGALGAGGSGTGAMGPGGAGGALAVGGAGLGGTNVESGGAGGSIADGGATAAGGAATSGGSAATGGAAAAGPIQIWLAGDSTVAGGNTPCPRGWGRHFAAQFDDRVTVINSAAGGRSVRTWLYSVTTTLGPDGECVLQTGSDGKPVLQTRWIDMLQGMKSGDYLFIQFGINDGSSTCDRHVGLEAFQAEYGKMAAEAKSRGVTPVFVTPVSAIACNGSTAIATRGGYVTATQEAGEEFAVPVIDLHRLSIEHYQELGFCPVPGGDVSASTTGPVGEYFCDDHTHFSESGAEDMAALVAGAVRSLGLPLTDYLK